MSQRVYQSLINQSREVIKCEFGLIDGDGIIVASSNEKRIGSYDNNFREVLAARQQVYILDDITYNNPRPGQKAELIGYVKNTKEDYINYLQLVVISACEVKNYFDEKSSRDKFYKNVIISNMMPADTVIKARDLNIDSDTHRAVVLIKCEWEKEIYVYDLLVQLFPDRTKDNVVILDEGNIVLIKELDDNADDKCMENVAKIIFDNVSTETMVKIQVGVGNIAMNIKQLSRSFKQAQEAIIIGNIFETDQNIYHYNRLGIGRLVYQLPVTACDLFISEIFKGDSLNMLDDETMTTITKFFENNLNVSEASRQLYIHRNTLVYRLDKILKTTGLDLTNFDDAAVFYISILLKKYLAAQEDGML